MLAIKVSLSTMYSSNMKSENLEDDLILSQIKQNFQVSVPPNGHSPLYK